MQIKIAQLPSKSLKTDSNGSSTVQLPCERDYTFTPVFKGYRFTPPALTRRLSRGTVSLDFRAEPAPRPTPTPVESRAALSQPAPPPCAGKDKVVAELALKNPPDSRDGKLGPLKSDCQSPGVYRDTYLLTGALGGDLVKIELAGTFSASLALQVIRPDGESVGSPARGFTGELSQDGNYKLNVINVSAPLESELSYTLTVTRTGVSKSVYEAQLKRALDLSGQPNATDFFQALDLTLKSEDRKLGEVTELLIQLKDRAPDRPEAFEMLGAIYLYDKDDLINAEKSFEAAIKKGGAARFRVYQGEDFEKKFDPDRANRGWLMFYRDRVEFAILEKRRRGPVGPNQNEAGFSLAKEQIEKCGIHRNPGVVFIKGQGWDDSANFKLQVNRQSAASQIIGWLNPYLSLICPR